MNLAVVCMLVGMAITSILLCVFWVVQRVTVPATSPGNLAVPGQPKPQPPTFPVTPRSRKGVRALYIQAGYQSSVGVVYVFIIGLLVMGLAIGRFLRIHPLLYGPASLIGAMMLPLTYLRMRGRKRQSAFLEQLPSALELLANGMRAGLGINSALEVVAQELSDPLGTEFSQMVTAMNLGGASLDRALAQLIERNPSNDLRLFAQALLVNKQVGGNLAEVLDNLDRTIRERFWLQRELHSATAEQRISAWILALLPAAMALVLTLLNRAYMSLLVTTVPGRYIIAIALGLELVGWLVLRQILRSVVDF